MSKGSTGTVIISGDGAGTGFRTISIPNDVSDSDDSKAGMLNPMPV